MALGDAYAEPADYRQRVHKTDTTDDAVLSAILKAASRYIDRRTRRRDGFNQSADVETRTYDILKRPGADAAYSADGWRLVLPDDIATTTGLVVKVDLNGDYAVAASGETLTINTDFWVGPANAATGSDPRPYYILDINPTTAAIGAWPVQRHALAITATFGFPEVPEAVKETTVLIARQIVDMQLSGATLALQQLDAVVQESRLLTNLMRDLVRMYSKPMQF